MENTEKMSSKLNAIVSVSNKAGLETLVPFLAQKGYTIYSTGGTYTKIFEILQSIESIYDPTNILRTVESLTGFPEILGGRVKTLHPRVYGGILADSDKNEHIHDMNEHNLSYFSLIVANLYPFKKTVAKNPEDLALCIENIDIGGVSLIRAASKNYKKITLLTEPSQYTDYIKNYDTLGVFDRMHYAISGFKMTSEYDTAIQVYLTKMNRNNLDIDKGARIDKSCALKYGLNPHQTPSRLRQTGMLDIDAFTLLNGNLGYINVLDMIHGWLTVRELEDVLNLPASISMKHTSPAGVGVGNEILSESLDIFGISDDLRQQLTPTAKAFIKARNGDPLSSFGDLIGVSGKVDEITARLIKREVCDGIVAADYDEEALKILMSKRGGKFIIIKMNMDYYTRMRENGWTEFKEMYGLQLSEPSNTYRFSIDDMLEKYGDKCDILKEKYVDFTLAYTVLKYAQSNNISMVYNGQVLGLGCGQQNRVGCVRLAGEKARNWMYRHSPRVIEYYRGLPSDMKRQAKVNAVYDFIENHEFSEKEKKEIEKYDVSLGSDGFFPFPDNIEVANEYNVKYILQPGGSMADEVVQEACDKHGIMMLNTGFRMFYH